MATIQRICCGMLCFLLVLTSSLPLHAQNNVGIGTATPLELLDVNGNMNLRGRLKLNNTEGNPGDLLSVGQDGNPGWAPAYEFTTFMTSYINNATVTIPATAKKVMIEAWGAGGGGAQGGGGASGSYAMGIFSISGTTTLTITIGEPGVGATTYTGSAENGGATTVTGTGIAVSAGGGRGANAFFGGLLLNNGALSGSVSGSARLRSILINGENGTPTTQTSVQVNSTTWHAQVQFGRGGHPPMGIGQGGHGSFREHNQAVAADGTAIKLYQGGFAGIAGGGGGGQRLGYGWGWDGGRGYVIVRY